MEPTEEQITARVAESLGQLSRAKAKEVLIRQFAQDAIEAAEAAAAEKAAKAAKK